MANRRSKRSEALTYLLQHSVALGLLAAILWLPGDSLERSGLGAGPQLRPLARLTLGLGFWIVCLFLLASSGWLRPSSLWAVVALVVLWAVALRLRSGSGSGHFPAVARPGLPTVLLLVVLAALLAPFFFLAMSPPVAWDASAYHLRVAELFAQRGGFREVPFNVYSYWPLNIQLLFAMAMVLHHYVLAKLLHFAFGAATLYALYLGGRTFHQRTSGLLAMGFFVANGVVAFELRVAYVDLAYAFFFLAGFLFLVAAREQQNGQALWLAGVACGLAAGVKVTGIIGAAVVGALYLPPLLKALRQRRAGPVWRPFLIRFVAPVLALWIPWILRTAWLTGNPFYPFFHDRLGGPDWSSHLTSSFQAWQSSIGMGREPIDYLLLPLRVILAGGEGYHRFDGELAAFWIALLPLTLWAARKNKLVRYCLSTAGLFSVFWAASSQQTRFLIPALSVLALAGGVAVVELSGRLSTAAWRRTGVALAALTSIGFLALGQGRVIQAGYRTLGVYLQAEGDLADSARHPVYRFINRSLPEDATVLFINTNQAFFCDREVIADSFFEASQIADWLAPAEDSGHLRRLLSERGVSHVLVENRPRGAVYPPTLGVLLRDPQAVRPIYRSDDGRFSVLELRERGA